MSIASMFDLPKYYGKNIIEFLCGDVIAVLKTLPDESIHSVMTSPPYFRMRDYQHPDQIGMEETPGEFIDKLVEVFREVKRVLRSDGTCWVNIGDSYAGSGKAGSTEAARKRHKQFNKTESACRQVAPTRTKYVYPPEMKPSAKLKGKDMIGVPWMLAFAMRDDGWYLRSDIIWNKEKGYTPESMNDRPTRSHEHIFMFSKAKSYFYDIDAIRKFSGANAPDVWTIGLEPVRNDHGAMFPTEIPRRIIKASTPVDGVCSECGQYYLNRQQICKCNNSNVVPAVVLDPFGGSCTTGLVAAELNRSAIMIDIKDDYLQIGYNRLKDAGYGKLLQDIEYIK